MTPWGWVYVLSLAEDGSGVSEYLWIDRRYRGRGVSKPLYVGMARWLASKGIGPLWASGLQSKSARGAWEAMARDKSLPISRRERPGLGPKYDGDRERYVLDYMTPATAVA